MGWSIYSHATTGDRRNPIALAVCDRCNFTYNRGALRWQYEEAGIALMNRGILVCRTCMDLPQPQLQTILVPMDPPPILNPRPGEFSGMAIQANPDAFNTVVPSQIVVEIADLGSDTQIGNRTPIVTEASSLPLTTEVTVTPYPHGEGDDSYTRMTGAST